ncbi:nitrous oxide reductase accessory protein NosL [Roseovarius sp. SCSIO 43702]|uniref:nitrous oxide reductase accessory protein NosL n=1 Tax=Roseovarius sp. SCSIO 43702 TaxID=2823043 RepID=UPI001C738CD9|nr:nitrous oxide reductase accessory protein NosL [Roseovarius sp. SCSIO 43702]QYX56109.1 nitrous oxide reductase accessory protein NosL [Roseovarius sp. SCSIO 43702]
MKRLGLVLICLLLAACKEEAAQDVTPVPLSADAVGHYCQMNLMEHDGPKAQAHLGGLPGAPLFFSQVRDVVAYLRMPEQSHEVVAVWVNDMGAPGASWEAPGARNWIDAEEAVYVVGADVVGGMGAPELVPFSDREAARAFAAANGGTVMTLDEIPDAAVLAPVELIQDSDDPDSDDSTFQERLRDLSDKIGD